MIAILDAGPLFAAVDASDQDHTRCLQVLQNREFELVVPALVVTEVSYFLNRRYGSTAEARFLRGLAAFEVEAPSNEEWAAIADLVDRYSNFPLGGADASAVVLAQRLNTDIIVTLDRRHFGALRMSDGRPFRLLPE